MVLLALSKTKDIVDLAGHSGKVYMTTDKICSVISPLRTQDQNLSVMNLSVIYDQSFTSARLELLKQLIIKHLEKKYLCPNNSLWIVLELSITLVVMVDFLLKLLNTLNTMVGSTQRMLILTLAKTVAATSQLKTSVYTFLILSTLLW